MNDLSNDIQYDKVLQELKREFDALMEGYLQKLHNAFHEDYGLKGSHVDIVNRIKRDCMSIFSDLERISFDQRSEEEVTKEILEYNYEIMDIQYMKDEAIDLFSHLASLSENCLKRYDMGWFTFGIHELIQNGKVDLGPRGSKRTQFCKCCSDPIYLSRESDRK